MTKKNLALSSTDKQSVLRVLRFLFKSSALPEESADCKRWLLVSEEGGTISCEKSVLDALNRAALIKVQSGKIVLSATGRQFLQGIKNTEDLAHAKVAEKSSGLIVNFAESPLALLYRKSKQSGKSFLSDDEFQAGERLRADFTRGNMLPSITANWEAGVIKRSRGERGAVAELSDHALDCRDRVEKALKAVGPELSGVLLDICCFLKGLELVERERLWPARSAKMMLKTGLSILHRHYTAGRNSSKAEASAYHWGTPDYRPSL